MKESMCPICGKVTTSREWPNGLPYIGGCCSNKCATAYMNRGDKPYITEAEYQLMKGK